MKYNYLLSEIEIDLRLAKGLNTEKVQFLEETMTLIIDEWKDKDYIPKDLAESFVGCYTSIEACSNLYNNDNKKNEILEFADHMLDLIKKCLNTY